MNISTLAKILGVSISDLRDAGQSSGIAGFGGRNTRIPYNSALEVTKILKPDKLQTLKNDDKIYLPSTLSVNDFAETIGKPPGMVVKTLILNGVMATLNEKIDYDTASLIAEELGVEVFPETDSMDTASTENDLVMIKGFDVNQSGTLISRPPVVTVMGHVDHGKTTLLDSIRKTNVVAQEAGAITQHISSYQISFKNKKITFIDTPGHEAFTAMRARGSQLADFIILVVSAAEGPKPQTVEVIERAKLTNTQVVVAINKIDLPNSDIEKTKTEISSFGLVPEEWGGDVPFIPISAKNSTNIDKLLDTILLFSDVANLQGEVNCPGQAVIIESHVDPKLGVISTALITKDKIKVGDNIHCGTQTARVRRLTDADSQSLQEAELAMPVMLLGLSYPADIGDIVEVHPTQKEALAATQKEREKNQNRRISSQVSESENDDSHINIVLKADVSGSLEALKESILKIPQNQVKIVIKSESIGQVTEGDVDFARLSDSTILAFHTSLNATAITYLKKQPVPIVRSDVIYEILNWVEEEILKKTKHEVKTTVIGRAEVLALFKADKPTIQVFGGEVKDGKILANKHLRLMREEEQVGIFEIVELHRNKAKTNEVNVNQQFGVSVTGKGKIQVGDIIECIDETIVT